MSLTLITLQATYTGGIEVSTGRVTFTALGWRTSTENNIIYVPQKNTFGLDENGMLQAVLQTRDEDDDPAYSYAVHEEIDGVTREYEITLPVAGAQSVIDLADLQPDGTWAAADILSPASVLWPSAPTFP